MSEWKEGKLSDLAEIEMGQSPVGETCNTNGNGMPLLNGPTEFGIRNPLAVQFTVDSKRLSRPGDVLFCVRGSTTGRMNWADKTYAIGRGLAAIRHRNGEAYKYFLRGVIDHKLPLLLASATGSTFPNISKSQLEELEISIPPLPEQKAIASILSSLDGKIDLLHRQNQTLEKMAETLFRQWFVEEAKEEWEESQLRDIVSKIVDNRGKTPPTVDFKTDYPLIEVNAINSDDCLINYDVIRKYVIDETYGNWFRQHLEKYDIIISTVGTIGVFSLFLNKVGCIAQNLVGLRFDKVSSFFVYNFLRTNIDTILNLDIGGVQPSIKVPHLLSLSLKLPPEGLINNFHRTVEPFYEKVKLNQTLIQNLAALRDNLLPKLMSGEVRVDFQET